MSESFFETLIQGEEWVYVLFRVGIILAITFIIAQSAQKIGANSERFDKLHIKFIRNIAVILIYLVGGFLMLSQIPEFEKGLTALLAGSGIVALSIGLAAQESVGNFINGLVLSMFKPFEVGDRIKLINGNITGIIEDITLRHTIIRTYLNSRVIIPNSVINKDLIENSNIIERRAAGHIDVTITYDSDMELAQKIIAEIIAGSPFALDEFRSSDLIDVFVCNLGNYGVELRATLWTDDINDNFKACSESRKTIKREFDKAGIKIASMQSRGSAGSGLSG